MRPDWDKVGVYCGYVAVSLGVLIPLQLPQLYYAYSEYDAISSLLRFLPTFTSVTIVFNIVIMPCSWTMLFIAIPQMLPQEDLPFKKSKFAKVIIGISFLFFILTIVNLSLFYSTNFPTLNEGLAGAFPRYLTEPSIQSAWDRATALMRCCGVNGPEDYVRLGLLSVSCTSNGLGCVQTIVNNFYVLWIWTLLSQAGAVVIALNGVLKDNETDQSLWKRIKSCFH